MVIIPVNSNLLTSKISQLSFKSLRRDHKCRFSVIWPAANPKATIRDFTEKRAKVSLG